MSQPSTPPGDDPAHAEEIRYSNEGLVRSLGLFTTITIVVGGVIGSGIFLKPGTMAGQVGSPMVLFAVWVVAGIITLFGAMTNAEIASIIPETGGQYAYFDRIFGPFVAFLFGWALLAVIQTGSIAALAIAFSRAADRIVPMPELSAATAAFSVHLPFVGDIKPWEQIGVKALAAALIVFLSAINYLGVRFGGWVQNISSIGKVGAMGALVLAAFLVPGVGHAANLTTPSTAIHPQSMFAAFMAALLGAFWAYDGWNKVTFVAGEIKEPQRNIPKGLVLGMFIVTGIYLSMYMAYAYVMPVDEMARSKLVAADVAEKCVTGGGKWIALAIMLSTFGACNATVLTTARIFFSMARRNVFPQFLGVAHPRFHTPAASLVIQCIWSIVLLFTGTYDTLTDTLIFVSWIFYAAVAYGVFILRKREPDTPRSYRVPGYPVVPWIFVIFSAVYLVVTVWNDVTAYREAVAAGKPAFINSAFGAALVLAGTPIYFYYRAKHRKSPAR